MAGDRPAFRLDIAFTPSLAFYIWQSLRKGFWPIPDPVPARLQQVWELAGEVCSTEGVIAASLANTAALSALSAADPLQTLSVDRLLYCQHGLGPREGLCVLPSASWPTRQLLLFAQLLALVAAKRDSMVASLPMPRSYEEEQNALESIIAGKLQCLTDASSVQPGLPSRLQLQTQDETDVQADQHGDPQTQAQTHSQRSGPVSGNSITLLRSAFRFAKLAALTSNVKADLIGHDDPQMPPAVVALWRLLSLLSDRIREVSSIMRESPDIASQPNEEEQSLCLALCRLLLGVLRQCMKQPKAGIYKVSCFDMLGAILSAYQSEQLMADMQKAGEQASPVHPLILSQPLLLTWQCSEEIEASMQPMGCPGVVRAVVCSHSSPSSCKQTCRKQAWCSDPVQSLLLAS